MKPTAITSVVAAVLISQAGAFSFDFTGKLLVGTDVSAASPLVVLVSGYGNIRFTMAESRQQTCRSAFLDGRIGIQSRDACPGKNFRRFAFDALCPDSETGEFFAALRAYRWSGAVVTAQVA